MTRSAVFLICLFSLVSRTAGAGSMAGRLERLPPDSTEAWIRVVKEGEPAYRAAVESLLAVADLRDPANQARLTQAGRAYCAVTRDSVLLADLSFLTPATPSLRKRWAEAVELDRRGFRLRNSDPKAAIPSIETAIALYAKTGPLRREAVAWGTLGTAYSNAADWTRAEACYQRALGLRERLGDPLWIGRALNTIGTAKFSLGDYDSALVYYERARAVREKIGHANDLALTLAYMGNAYYKQGNYPNARAYYEAALEQAGPGVSPEVAVSAREGLGNVLTGLGEYEEAASVYRDVVARREAAGDAAGAASTRGNLATVLTRLGDHAAALAELDRARVTFLELEDPRLADILNKAGNVQTEIGNFKDALRLYQAALDTSKTSGNRAQVVNILLNLGAVTADLGATDRALEILNQAQALADSLDDMSARRDALSKLAIVHEKRGEYAEALRLTEAALAIDLKMGDRDNVAISWTNLGIRKMQLGRLEEGGQDIRTGLGLAREVGNQYAIWMSTLNLADYYELKGDLDSARVLNDRAIEIMESARISALGEETKADFLQERAFLYEAQVNVLGKLSALHPKGGNEARAWNVAERGKARALRDVLDEAGRDLTAGVDSSLILERSRLERECNEIGYTLRWAEERGVSGDSLRTLQVERDHRESALRVILDRMRFQNPRLAAVNPGHEVDLDRMRASLLSDPDALLLEYVLGDSGSYVFAITRKEIILRPLPGKEAIQGAARRLRQALETDALRHRGRAPSGVTTEEASWDRDSALLYTMILEPIAPELDRAHAVTIIPDDALQYVPFELLIDRRPEGKSPSYALRGKTVRYAPSANVLVKLAGLEAKSDKRPPSFLGVGDPVFTARPASADLAGTAGATVMQTATLDSSFQSGDGGVTRSGLAPLPNTRKEIEAIETLFDPRERRALLGRDARESAFRDTSSLARFRILHFATHGLPDERSPMRSCLALSYPEDPSEDGYLQASEIYRLHLDADLVVLSACETGKGKMVRGEGVLGLPRAFFYAGARNVLVSLWSVSDEATADLMTAFYKEMIGQHRRPAEALSRAKNEMIESSRWAHPFYWAGFVLMGPG